MLSDAQLDELRTNTSDTIGMIGNFLNSASLWELLGSTLGLVLCVALLTWIVGRVFGWVGFYSR